MERLRAGSQHALHEYVGSDQTADRKNNKDGREDEAKRVLRQHQSETLAEMSAAAAVIRY